jgi:hypothetical protein
MSGRPIGSCRPILIRLGKRVGPWALMGQPSSCLGPMGPGRAEPAHLTALRMTQKNNLKKFLKI